MLPGFPLETAPTIKRTGRPLGKDWTNSWVLTSLPLVEVPKQKFITMTSSRKYLPILTQFAGKCSVMGFLTILSKISEDSTALTLSFVNK